jgi:hypothetical protein
MIQSGLLPNTWQQLISWMIQKHVKRQLVESFIIEYGREMKITPWIALNGMRRAGQSCNGYSYVYGARFEEQHIG